MKTDLEIHDMAGINISNICDSPEYEGVRYTERIIKYRIIGSGIR